MDAAEVARILGQVPEKHLALVELAWRCVGPDDRFDLDLAIPMAADIEVALQEARGYIAETQNLRWALEKLAKGR
ncbi:hypothetical protein LCGC14_0938830 [marine sediment metagenome]|uniref:Uncharacterized protein n=1 Tax=marine sediment metagenome TaxID=412755 RepID=A0A0F9NKT4_9ZZZZ